MSIFANDFSTTDERLGREHLPACRFLLDPPAQGPCNCEALTLADVFGAPIFVYTRAQAIEDGTLVDLSTFSFRPGLTILQEVGIKYPEAMTRAAYCLAIQDDGAELPPCQYLSGRMWDVVYMMKLAIRRSDGPELGFTLSVVNWHHDRPGRTIRETVNLKAICGPGDDAEPVITIMLPNED